MLIDHKPVFVGVFDSITAPAFPVRHAKFYLVNKWAGGRGDHTESFCLVSPDGMKTILEGPSTEFSLPDRSGSHTVQARVENVEFERPGTYWVQIFLNGEMVVEYPLPVVKASIEEEDEMA